MGWTFYNASGQRLQSHSQIAQAVQSDIEGETNQDTYVPPDLIKHSPGVAKASVNFNSATAIQGDTYNVTDVTDVGVGDFTVNLTVAFSSTEYTTVVSHRGCTYLHAFIDAGTGTSCTSVVSLGTDHSTKTDGTRIYYVAHGDQ